MPNKDTKFKPISELPKYSDKEKYFCNGVVFSPETENDHFDGCPPYIEICSIDGFDDVFFFEVPEIVAYYAKTHPCYTMQGIKNNIEKGERRLANKIKDLLDIDEYRWKG